LANLGVLLPALFVIKCFSFSVWPSNSSVCSVVVIS